MGCTLAYESAGLLWAARTSALAAATQSFAEFWENGTIIRPALMSVQKLVWLELQLGRVSCVLAWIEASGLIASQLRLKGEREVAFLESRDLQDKMLGLLFLLQPQKEIERLHFLPDILERMNLLYARMALLYALGYESVLRDEGYIPQSETPQAVHDLFRQWARQPARADLPTNLEMSDGSKDILRSTILGCQVVGTASREVTSIQFLEMIIGVLEAVLSTGMEANIIPHCEQIRINVEQSSEPGLLPRFEVTDTDGETIVEVRHPQTMPLSTAESKREFYDWIVDLVAHLMERFFVIPDPSKFFERLGRDERAFARALSFSEASVFVNNILGRSPKLLLLDWQKTGDHRSFPFERGERWSSDENIDKGDEVGVAPSRPTFADEAPTESPNFGNIKHRQRRTISLIDVALWDKARWRGTGFMWTDRYDIPPIVALIFEDKSAGRLIFEGWRKRFGITDRAETLRISILTGIDNSNPAAYRVVIGTDLKGENVGAVDEFFILVSRINTMEPRHSRNLDGFIDRYNRLKRYGIVPAQMHKSGEPEFFLDLAIEKSELHVRPAWEVGPNDPDLAGIAPDDKPIIPSIVKDPPPENLGQSHALPLRTISAAMPVSSTKHCATIYSDLLGANDCGRAFWLRPERRTVFPAMRSPNVSFALRSPSLAAVGAVELRKWTLHDESLFRAKVGR
jgi:hypothetical protein